MATFAAVSLLNPSGEAPVSCGQNIALATLETNVLLLRRSPRSSAASEPTAMVRRRNNLGALANMSSAVTSVPWRVRYIGIGALLANVNWFIVATVSWTMWDEEISWTHGGRYRKLSTRLLAQLPIKGWRKNHPP
jgi:hypothetical protein